LVETAFLSGDQWLALYSSFHALNLAEETGPSPELAEAYGPVGVIYGAIPWRWAAGRYLDRAVRTARQVESPSALGYALLAYSSYAVGNADWDKAQSMSGELVELGRRIGARKRLSDGLQLLTCASYSQGRFEDCIAAADELLASASRGRDPRFSAYGYFAKAYGCLYLGRPDEALVWLAQIPDLLGAQSVTTDRQLELMNRGLMAAAYLRLGRANEALEAAVGALERQAGAPLDLGYSLPGYALTADVLLKLWESGHPDPDLPDKAKQACHSLKRFARLYASGRPYARLCLGSYAWLSGKPGRAARHWRAAVTSSEELGMPFVAGCGHLELTRGSAEASPNREEHARLACQIFDELQTPHEYARAVAILKGAQDGT
jgi:tetratricopeptide (TPR) repeat protein